MHTSDRNDFSGFFALQAQRFLVVARGLVKVGRRALRDPDLTDSPFSLTAWSILEE